MITKLKPVILLLVFCFLCFNAFAADLSIGLGVDRSPDLAFLNEKFRENDIAMVRDRNAEVSKEIKKAKRCLVIGSKAAAQASDLSEKVKRFGINQLGYNLEGKLTYEELVNGEKKVLGLARELGLEYIFGPGVRQLEKYYKDFALYADIIVLQSQRYQTNADYQQTVTNLIAKIRMANPRVKVWVQVSVNPPGDRGISVERVKQNINSIKDSVDGIFIFYIPSRWPQVKELISWLRP